MLRVVLQARRPAAKTHKREGPCPFFDETQILPSRPNASAKDAVLPNLGLLQLKSMPTPTALSGTTGADCMLVHQDVWEQLEADKTTNILKNLMTEISGNESWNVEGDFQMYVTGTTTDTRVGTHHQTNVDPRFDHFVQTRHELHDQPENVHQPTYTFASIVKWLEVHGEKHSFTGLYWSGNGVKLEVDGVEATEKLVVLGHKLFRLENGTFDLSKKDVRIALRAFALETVPAKIYASLTHLKAVLSNLAAGIRGAFSAPWGS